MAWLGYALGGLGALGGLFGLGQQKTSTNVDNTTTTTPNLTPENQAFQKQLISMYQNLLNGAGSGQFQQAYTTQGLKNINQTQQQSQQAISDLLTSRGLGKTSAGVGTLGDVAESGANESANFLNSVPLTMDQRLQTLLGSAGGYQASIPVGTSVNQQGTVAVNSGPPSGLLGGVQGGIAATASVLGQQSAANNFANALKGVFGNGSSSGGYNPVNDSDESNGFGG